SHPSDRGIWPHLEGPDGKTISATTSRRMVRASPDPPLRAAFRRATDPQRWNEPPSLGEVAARYPKGSRILRKLRCKLPESLSRAYFHAPRVTRRVMGR